MYKVQRLFCKTWHLFTSSCLPFIKPNIFFRGPRGTPSSLSSASLSNCRLSRSTCSCSKVARRLDGRPRLLKRRSSDSPADSKLVFSDPTVSPVANTGVRLRERRSDDIETAGLITVWKTKAFQNFSVVEKFEIPYKFEVQIMGLKTTENEKNCV